MDKSRATYTFTKNMTGKILRFVSTGSNLQATKRLYIYLGIAFAALLIIWIPVSSFLIVVKPSYFSKWTLILPGGGAGHAVSLDSVGQASATVASPYANHSVDPKINYKEIASSSQVLKAAAAEIGISREEFGRPVIKLVDQTAMIHFRQSGKTGKEAFDKADALFKAFKAELEGLRNDEQQRKEQATNQVLRSFREKLSFTQQQILEYQTHSNIVSLEQFNELTLGLEQSQHTLREMEAEQAGLQAQLATLEATLAIKPVMAFAVLRLQTDPIYLQLMDKHAESTAVLAKNTAQWGDKNLEVITARDIHDTLKTSLLARVQEVADQSQVDPRLLGKFGSTGNQDLFTQLITLYSQEQGMVRQIETLKLSAIQQQKILEDSTFDASKLEDLKRKHQVATAVYTTALAKIDLGKSDRFTTYPMVQLFSAPEKPEKPETMPRKFAFAGALFGTFFVLIGLILLWIRKPYLQKILKNV